MIPKLNYSHLHKPKHLLDYILSTLVEKSLTLAVENNQLLLRT